MINKKEKERKETRGFSKRVTIKRLKNSFTYCLNPCKRCHVLYLVWFFSYKCNFLKSKITATDAVLKQFFGNKQAFFIHSLSLSLSFKIPQYYTVDAWNLSTTCVGPQRWKPHVPLARISRLVSTMFLSLPASSAALRRYKAPEVHRLWIDRGPTKRCNFGAPAVQSLCASLRWLSRGGALGECVWWRGFGIPLH